MVWKLWEGFEEEEEEEGLDTVMSGGWTGQTKSFSQMGGALDLWDLLGSGPQIGGAIEGDEVVGDKWLRVLRVEEELSPMIRETESEAVGEVETTGESEAADELLSRGVWLVGEES